MNENEDVIGFIRRALKEGREYRIDPGGVPRFIDDDKPEESVEVREFRQREGIPPEVDKVKFAEKKSVLVYLSVGAKEGLNKLADDLGFKYGTKRNLSAFLEALGQGKYNLSEAEHSNVENNAYKAGDNRG